MKNFPDQVRSAIRTAIHNAEKADAVFDVYQAGMEICGAFPDAHLLIEDIVDSMVDHLSGIQAVEFSPPGLIIEFLIPVDDDHEILSAQLPKEGALLGRAV